MAYRLFDVPPESGETEEGGYRLFETPPVEPPPEPPAEEEAAPPETPAEEPSILERVGGAAQSVLGLSPMLPGSRPLENLASLLTSEGREKWARRARRLERGGSTVLGGVAAGLRLAGGLTPEQEAQQKYDQLEQDRQASDLTSLQRAVDELDTWDYVKGAGKVLGGLFGLSSVGQPSPLAGAEEVAARGREIAYQDLAPYFDKGAEYLAKKAGPAEYPPLSEENFLKHTSSPDWWEYQFLTVFPSQLATIGPVLATTALGRGAGLGKTGQLVAGRGGEILSSYLQNTGEHYKEFEQAVKEGKISEEKARTLAKVSGTLAAAFDVLGAEGLLNRFPGLKKALYQGVVKVFWEGSTEGIQNVIQQMGQKIGYKKTFSFWEALENFLGGLMGGAGGVAMTGLDTEPYEGIAGDEGEIPPILRQPPPRERPGRPEILKAVSGKFGPDSPQMKAQKRFYELLDRQNKLRADRKLAPLTEDDPGAEMLRQRAKFESGLGPRPKWMGPERGEAPEKGKVPGDFGRTEVLNKEGIKELSPGEVYPELKGEPDFETKAAQRDMAKDNDTLRGLVDQYSNRVASLEKELSPYYQGLYKDLDADEEKMLAERKKLLQGERNQLATLKEILRRRESGEPQQGAFLGEFADLPPFLQEEKPPPRRPAWAAPKNTSQPVVVNRMVEDLRKVEIQAAPNAEKTKVEVSPEEEAAINESIRQIREQNLPEREHKAAVRKVFTDFVQSKVDAAKKAAKEKAEEAKAAVKTRRLVKSKAPTKQVSLPETPAGQEAEQARYVDTTPPPELDLSKYPQRIRGRSDTIATADGRVFRYHYELGEQEDSLPSNDMRRGFEPRPGFPEDAQERDYKKDLAHQAQLYARATPGVYNPDLINAHSPTAKDGPPVEDKKHVVLAGNSRDMGQEYVWANPELEELREMNRRSMKKWAVHHGFAEEDIDKFQHPGYKRVLDDPVDPKDYADLSRAFNKDLGTELKATTKGVSEAKLISKETLDALAADLEDFETLSEYLASSRSKKLLENLVRDKVYSPAEIQKLENDQGDLTEEAKLAIKHLLRGKVFPDKAFLSNMSGASKALLNKIDKSIIGLFRLTQLPAKWNIIPALKDAMQEYILFVKSNMGIDDYLDSKELIPEEGAPPSKRNVPRVAFLMRALESMSPKSFREGVNRYADLVAQAEAGQAGLLGNEIKNADDALFASFEGIPDKDLSKNLDILHVAPEAEQIRELKKRYPQLPFGELRDLRDRMREIVKKNPELLPPKPAETVAEKPAPQPEGQPLPFARVKKIFDDLGVDINDTILREPKNRTPEAVIRRLRNLLNNAEGVYEQTADKWIVDTIRDMKDRIAELEREFAPQKEVTPKTPQAPEETSQIKEEESGQEDLFGAPGEQVAKPESPPEPSSKEADLELPPSPESETGEVEANPDPPPNNQVVDATLPSRPGTPNQDPSPQQRALEVGDKVRFLGELAVIRKIMGKFALIRTESMTSDKAYARVLLRQLEPVVEPDQAYSKRIIDAMGQEDAENAAKSKPRRKLSFPLGADKARLIDVLGASQYSENLAYVAVKELVQNCLDACKTAIYLGKAKKGKISIKVDSNTRIIEIIDNGVGMNEQILTEGFFTIAGSEKEMPPEMCSGGFGFAKLAFMMGSEWLEVDTVRDGLRYTVKVTSKDIARQKIEPDEWDADPKEHGTKIRVKIPESFVDPKTGETASIWFPSYVSSVPFLEEPLLGNVEVVEVDPDTGQETALPLGANQDLSGYREPMRVNYDWGYADVYYGTEKAQEGTYGGSRSKHHILSAGVHQFKTGFEIESYKKIPYDIIVDIHSRVKPDHQDYPFNTSREDFKKRMEPEIKALAAYLRQIALGLQADELRDTFKDVQTFPHIDAGSLEDEIEFTELERKRLDAAFDELKRKLREAEKRQEERKAQPLPTEINVKKNKKKEIIAIADAKTGRSLVPKENIKNPTFVPDKKAAEMKDFAIDMGAIDPQRPIWHNNTNVDFPAISGDPVRAQGLFAALGSLFVDMRNDVAKSGLWFAHELAGNFFVGIGLDKTYQGVRFKVPYAGALINPLGMYRGKGFFGLRESMVDTMIHELAHVAIMDHNENHNSYMQQIKTYLAEKGILDHYRGKVLEILIANADIYETMRGYYERSDTQNAGKSLEGSKVTPPVSPRPGKGEGVRGSGQAGNLAVRGRQQAGVVRPGKQPAHAQALPGNEQGRSASQVPGGGRGGPQRTAVGQQVGYFANPLPLSQTKQTLTPLVNTYGVPATLLPNLDHADPVTRAEFDKRFKNDAFRLIWGWFDPDTGRIYLVGNNMGSAEEVVRIYLHEVVGHYGISKILGPKDREWVTQEAVRLYGQEYIDHLITHHGYESYANKVELGVDELLAYLAEEQRHAPFLKKVIFRIKRWLYSHGIKTRLTEADFIALVAQSRSYLTSQRKAAQKGGKVGGLQTAVGRKREGKPGELPEHVRGEQPLFDIEQIGGKPGEFPVQRFGSKARAMTEPGAGTLFDREQDLFEGKPQAKETAPAPEPPPEPQEIPWHYKNLGLHTTAFRDKEGRYYTIEKSRDGDYYTIVKRRTLNPKEKGQRIKAFSKREKMWKKIDDAGWALRAYAKQRGLEQVGFGGKPAAQQAEESSLERYSRELAEKEGGAKTPVVPGSKEAKRADLEESISSVRKWKEEREAELARTPLSELKPAEYQYFGGAVRQLWQRMRFWDKKHPSGFDGETSREEYYQRMRKEIGVGPFTLESGFLDSEGNLIPQEGVVPEATPEERGVESEILAEAKYTTESMQTLQKRVHEKISDLLSRLQAAEEAHGASTPSHRRAGYWNNLVDVYTAVTARWERVKTLVGKMVAGERLDDSISYLENELAKDLSAPRYNPITNLPEGTEIEHPWTNRILTNVHQVGPYQVGLERTIGGAPHYWLAAREWGEHPQGFGYTVEEAVSQVAETEKQSYIREEEYRSKQWTRAELMVFRDREHDKLRRIARVRGIPKSDTAPLGEMVRDILRDQELRMGMRTTPEAEAPAGGGPLFGTNAAMPRAVSDLLDQAAQVFEAPSAEAGEGEGTPGSRLKTATVSPGPVPRPGGPGASVGGTTSLYSFPANLGQLFSQFAGASRQVIRALNRKLVRLVHQQQNANLNAHLAWLQSTSQQPGASQVQMPHGQVQVKIPKVMTSPRVKLLHNLESILNKTKHTRNIYEAVRLFRQMVPRQFRAWEGRYHAAVHGLTKDQRLEVAQILDATEDPQGNRPVDVAARTLRQVLRDVHAFLVQNGYPDLPYLDSYLPHIFEGNYWVTGIGPSRKVRTIREALVLADQFLAANPGAQVSVFQDTFLPYEEGTLLSRRSFQRLGKALQQAMGQSYPLLQGLTQKEIRDLLVTQKIARPRPRKRFFGNMMPRLQNNPNFIMDLDKIFSFYLYQASRKAYQDKLWNVVQKNVEAMPVEQLALKTWVMDYYMPTVLAHPAPWEAAVAAWLNEPTLWGSGISWKTAPWKGRVSGQDVRKFFHNVNLVQVAMDLGLSVPSLVANATQYAIATYPIVGEISALAGFYKGLKSWNDPRLFLELEEQGITSAISSLSSQVVGPTFASGSRGILWRDMLQEIWDNLGEGFQERSPWLVITGLLETGLAPFGVVEMQNRFATYWAGKDYVYRYLKSHGPQGALKLVDKVAPRTSRLQELAEAVVAGRVAPEEFAKQFGYELNDKANFRTGRENLPQLLQQAPVRTLIPYKSFILNMLQISASRFGRAFSKGEIPELLRFTMGSIALGGLAANPLLWFSFHALNMLRNLFGDDDDDWLDRLRRRQAPGLNWTLHGVPSEVVGVDISGSVAVKLPRLERPQEVLGRIGTLGVLIAQYAMEHPHTAKTAKKIARQAQPSEMQRVLDAFDMVRSGVYRTPITATYIPLQNRWRAAFGRIVAGMPKEAVRQFDLEEANNRRKKFFLARAADLTERLGDAISDPKKMEPFLDRVMTEVSESFQRYQRATQKGDTYHAILELSNLGALDSWMRSDTRVQNLLERKLLPRGLTEALQLPKYQRMEGFYFTPSP
jgi:hypothetical protein